MKIKFSKPWSVVAIAFLLTFIVCIGFIFAPIQRGEGDIVYSSDTILTPAWGQSHYEAWTRYPGYTIGLGIAAWISLSGMVFCLFQMNREAKYEKVI